MTDELVIEDLHASIAGNDVLKGVNLRVAKGEVHAIMGPNGSGKSTLSYVLMGHSGYEVTRGAITYKDRNVLALPVDARAKLGLFLAFQYPMSIPGVTVMNFLRASYNSVKGKDLTPMEFNLLLLDKMRALNVDKAFARRYVNEGFSGGEKKRIEILQMAVLDPEVAVLDEPDSGLDIDAVRLVADGINQHRGPGRAFLIITHYQRILNYVTPDRVSIMMDGRIVRTGPAALAMEVEEKGYDWLRVPA